MPTTSSSITTNPTNTANTWTAAQTFKGTVTIGVDDTGHDVKMFGAAAGAYMLWDEDANLLDIRGATAAGPGHLKLTTGELTVVNTDVLGKIEFQAPLETGTDAITVAAKIEAVAQDTFSATVNATDLVFYTGHSEAATEKFRFTSQGEIGVGGANYGTDGQVLTSGGAGAAAAWEDAGGAGDIEGVTAGTGLSGGGTTGTVTLAVEASQTQITSVGALGTGSIAAGFGAIDNGTSGIRTNTFTAETSIVPDAASGATLGTTSLEWGHIYIGDDQKLYLGDGQDASLEYDEDGTNQLRITGATVFENDMEVADSKFIEFASAAGTPTTDNTVQGIVIEFLAVEAITQFDAVYVSTTTGRVGRADANDAAKMPVIGIAIEAQGSAGSSVRVLTHGVYRDDGGFGGNMTVGVDLYAPETPGTLTTTRPSDDGDFIQVIGVATGVRSAFINPSMDVIEHA